MTTSVTPDPEISPVKVLTHVHDEGAGVYKLVVGREVFIPEHLIEEPMLDEHGEPQYDMVPSLDDDNEPILDSDGQPQMVPQMRTSPKTVAMTVVAHIDVLDYVFADDDDRWFDADGARYPDDVVAEEQKRIVKDSIHETVEQARQADTPRELPGVGEEL
jgi:hypothetical protein